MKAFVCKRYGDAASLRLEEVEPPTPAANEIRISMRATSLNSWDWENLSGNLLSRIFSPFKPVSSILGGDAAGIVDAIGEEVTEFKVGDRVFGDLSGSGWGAFAQYAKGHKDAFALIPDGVSFEQAATIPQAGLLAAQSVDLANIQPGQHVLINGGGGGAGMYAILLAKYFGATVSAVDSAAKQTALKDFGADHTYDYAKTDYTKLDQKFDVIIDVTAKRAVKSYRGALAPDGHFIAMGGKLTTLLGIFIASKKQQVDDKKFNLVMWRVSEKDLTALAEMIRDAKITPIIERVFEFKDLPDAMSAQAKFTAKGKHVVRLG